MTRDVSSSFPLTTMSTSFATSLDLGHSGPRTPPRPKQPPAKSSPVEKVYKYHLPENHEQYQKFGFDGSFMLEAFTKPSFLEFLGVGVPKKIPNIDKERRDKDSFVTFANEVAKSIKDKRKHYLFLYSAFLPTYDFHFRFPKAGCSSVQRHGK